MRLLLLFLLVFISIHQRDAKWMSFIRKATKSITSNPFRRYFSFTRDHNQQQSSTSITQSKGHQTNKEKSRTGHVFMIPPLIVFFLGCHECQASPLDPQKIVISGPFFQGWLFRNVDHDKNLSFIVIIGSFSPKGNDTYIQHYIFCGVDTPSKRHHIECFPSTESVSISSTAPGSNYNIKWHSEEHGGFELQGDECTGYFTFDDLTLRFRSTKRLPWSRTQPVTGGPEGWLGKTNLLPCHYYIYSTGSECEYTLMERLAIDSRTEVPTSSSINGSVSETTSHGIMHIEGNYGTFFPSGWIWAQAVAAGNEASLSVIGGKFTIGAFSPLSFVIYYRYKRRGGPITATGSESGSSDTGDVAADADSEYDVQVFRSTDLDRFQYRIDGVTGDSYIEAYSLLNDRKLVVRLTPCSPDAITTRIGMGDPVNVVQSSVFGQPIHIPTAKGFSNRPGCKETYTATAKVSLYQFNYSRMTYDLVHESRINQTALEYGANFQGKVITNSKDK